MSSRLRFHLLLLLLAITLASLGCVRRRMTIRSNPPGALVYVDDQEVGFTPVSVPFTYYATRKIQIQKAAYRTETVQRTFYPVWYEIPPLDFVSENLVPYELRDEREVHFELVPLPIVPREELLGRAGELRGRTPATLPGAAFPSGTPPPLFAPPPGAPPAAGFP